MRVRLLLALFALLARRRGAAIPARLAVGLGVLAVTLQGSALAGAPRARSAPAHQTATGDTGPSAATQAAGKQEPSGQPTREANRDPHGPADVGKHIAWLESPKRLSFQKPDEVIAALGLHPAAVVADLGCGPGAFARRLAKVVPQGLVYAVDVEPRQLYRLHEHLLAEELHNVVPVLSSLADPHLPPGEIDLILVVDTYHHFDDRGRYLHTLSRALKPEGRLAIVDYYKRPLPVGPPVDHKIARDQVIKEVQAAGYRLVEEPTFLPHQYFLVFSRANADGGPPAERE